MAVNTLFLKHRLIVSPLSETLLSLRHKLSRFENLRHPELALLHEEDHMMRSAVRKALPNDAVCVDVGAHIGSVTQLFRSASPDGQHIMVEASPSKAGWLRTAFPNYLMHQVAVSDTQGEVSFFENLDNPGFSSLGARSSRGEVREIKAKCTTLDLLLSDTPRIDLIKIDVEGFERQVISGARDTLARLRPPVIFEAGAVKDPDIDNESYDQLFEMLTQEMGYDIRPIYGWYFNHPPISAAEFNTCRTYPFTAFNYIAHPKGAA